MKYRTTQDIVIPAGTLIRDAAVKAERFTAHGEAVLAMGREHCASIVFDDELMKSERGLFSPDFSEDRRYEDRSAPPDTRPCGRESEESHRVAA